MKNFETEFSYVVDEKYVKNQKTTTNFIEKNINNLVQWE